MKAEFREVVYVIIIIIIIPSSLSLELLIGVRLSQIRCSSSIQQGWNKPRFRGKSFF